VLRQAADGLDLAIDRAAVDEVIRAGGGLGQLDPAAVDLDPVIVVDFVEGV
jgi:NitT/TauT family transport system substrate-binding protein